MRTILAAAAVLAAGAVEASEIQVGMSGSQYSPQQIEAKVGDTLVFTNDDFSDHAVFVPTSGFGIHFGNQKPGEIRKLPLMQEGAFEIECVVHRDMLTKVMVTK